MAGRLVTWGQEDGAPNVNLTTIDGILKEDYVMENIIDTVNMATYLLSRLQSERTTAGRRFVFPLRFGVGEGIGNRREREALPEEGFGEYDQAMGNVVLHYGTLNISGPAISATEGGRATFVSALKQALKDVRDGFRLDTHRQSWGDSSGTMALAVGGASATQFVTRPYGVTYNTAELEPSQVVRQFRKGMKILFVTAGQVRTITGVNGDGSLTLNSTVTTTANERIVRGDSTTLHNDAKEYLGVMGGVQATGTYLGIPRAGEPAWQSNLIDLNNEPLTEDVLQHAFDTAEINGDGVSAPNMLISEHRVRRFYQEILTAQKRFVSPTVLKGGYSVLDFSGQPWVVDKLAPPQRIFYLQTADWVWFVMENIGWANKDGTVLKWHDGYDAYRAVLRAYRNLIVKQPANQTMLFNVTQGAES